MVYRLLPQIKPDIIVITGHDGVLKHRDQRSEYYNLNGYKNSQNFVNAVQVARDYDKSRMGWLSSPGRASPTMRRCCMQERTLPARLAEF